MTLTQNSPTTSLYSQIQSWDLSNIMQFVKLEYPEITSEMWVEAQEEYRNFVYLCLITRKQLTIPNKVMDYIWHAHILHTRDYLAFCETVNDGNYFHHQPELYNQNNFEEALEKSQQISQDYLGYNAFANRKDVAMVHASTPKF